VDAEFDPAPLVTACERCVVSAVAFLVEVGATRFGVWLPTSIQLRQSMFCIAVVVLEVGVEIR
jgi:hypothetical protein